MPDVLPQEKPRTPGDAPDEETTHSPGKARDGAHLKRRQDRNADLTEASQTNPTGGAHSGSPDHNNP